MSKTTHKYKTFLNVNKYICIEVMFCDSNQSFQYTFTCLDLGSRKLQRGLVSWSAKNMLASCCFPLDWKNLLWLAKNLEENRASASSWDSSQLTYKSLVGCQFFSNSNVDSINAITWTYSSTVPCPWAKFLGLFWVAHSVANSRALGTKSSCFTT